MSDVRLVKEATALLSMRDSDFDAYSACGEVVDNSIQADATFSRIKVDYKVSTAHSRKGRSEIVTEIAFGDDGIGMGHDTLHRCLQLGYSTRYNDRTGIGRFGVGMTLAAINQCKRVEIYSKQSGGNWLWTYIDIDEIIGDPPDMEGIPEPVGKALPKDYMKIAGVEHGTVVVWSKYDRPSALASKMIEGMSVWCGRTYRHFIWKGFVIEINSAEVRAIDPLYVTTEKTLFPDDPPAYEYKTIQIPWSVPLIEKTEDAPDESIVRIRMSLIDEKFRPIIGSGGWRDARSRSINENEGVSILRNGREVFHGHIPYFKWKFEEIDRWWGCEISFDAVLDRAFTVKNIKRGAVPVTPLKDAIYDKIKPTIESALEKVRAHWKETEFLENKAKTKSQGDGLATGHEAAERVAASTSTDKSEIDKHKDLSDEAKKIAQALKADENKQQKDAWAIKFASQPFSIIDDRWRGPDFFETNHLGGTDVIKYNLDHPFFSEIVGIIEIIENSPNDLKNMRSLKQLIDLLLISYSKAEAKFDHDMRMTTEEFIDYLRQNWGQYLKNYLITWKSGVTQDEDNS